MYSATDNKTVLNRAMPRLKSPSTRALKYVAVKTSGVSSMQAALSAGYAKSTARNPKRDIETVQVKESLEMSLLEAGITLESICHALKEGLEAVKAESTKKGVMQVADHAIRHRYLETTLKLMGLLKQPDIDAKIAVLQYQKEQEVEQLRESPPIPILGGTSVHSEPK